MAARRENHLINNNFLKKSRGSLPEVLRKKVLPFSWKSEHLEHLRWPLRGKSKSGLQITPHRPN